MEELGDVVAEYPIIVEMGCLFLDGKVFDFEGAYGQMAGLPSRNLPQKAGEDVIPDACGQYTIFVAMDEALRRQSIRTLGCRCYHSPGWESERRAWV